MLKSKFVDLWSEEDDSEYPFMDTERDEIISLAADCITLLIFIMLASLVLHLVSDRSFTNSYLKKDGVFMELEDSSPLVSLDTLVADKLVYYGLLVGDITYAEAASDGKKNAELFSTEDYKKYQKYLKKNSDTVGWISIGGLIVDYPIVWRKNNSYYLEHNFDGKKDVYGSIFLDQDSEGKFQKVNIVHGHNMKDGKMFGELDKYKDKNFFKEHKYLSLTTKDGTKRFQIFSVLVTDGSQEKIRTSFENDNDFQKYLKKINRRSLYELEYKDNPKSIVVLNTCSYEFTSAHLLIFAEEL